MNKKKVIGILTMIVVIAGAVVTLIQSQPTNQIVTVSDSALVDSTTTADSTKTDSTKVIVPTDSTKK